MKVQNRFIEKQTLIDSKVLAIFGNIGSGKTALAFKLVEDIVTSKTPVYFINHPKPQLIEEIGYKNLRNIGMAVNVQDSIIVWDEPQLSFNDLSEHKKNQLIIRLISLIRQKDNVLILSSSDTRALSARIESYIGLWMVKNIDYATTKQRSIIREIIKSNSAIPELPGIELKKNEFIAHSSVVSGISGIYNFDVADNWSEELSKAYKS